MLGENLFEHEITCWLKKPLKCDVLEDEGPHAQITCRIIDPEMFEAVIASIRGTDADDAREWIENLYGLEKGNLDGEFTDHKITLFVGRDVCTLQNCKLSNFKIDHKDLGVTFQLDAYTVASADFGKITELVGAQVALRISRADHWQGGTIDALVD